MDSRFTPKSGQSNYDMMQAQAQSHFKTYDVQPAVDNYGLKTDDEFVYITFLCDAYRVNKKTGLIEGLQKKNPCCGCDEALGGSAEMLGAPGESSTGCGKDLWTPSGFNESMTIYDVLCYAKPDAKAFGEFVNLSQVKGVYQSAKLAGNFFDAYKKRFEVNLGKLKKACEALGGRPYPVGDVAFQIDMFPFLPVLFQFWAADEDFGSQMTIKWDKNAIDFMHFETTYYAAGCLFKKLSDFAQSM